MTLPHVAVGSLGGTITMTPAVGQAPPQPPGAPSPPPARPAPSTAGGPDAGAPADGGVQPTLGAADLLASVPSLAGVAQIEAVTLATLPGASLSLDDVLAALDWAAEAVKRGAAGVVLVQGTDTLEETAYLLDLFWDRPEPLVVTGAMRPPSAPGPDGPANLFAAVVVAASPLSRDRGVVVVMNDLVHAATRVRKSHSTATDAFTSGDFGPLARVQEGAVTYGNRVRRMPPLPRPASPSPSRVALVQACLGDGARLLELVVQDGYDGVVVSAFGAGHVSRALAEVIEATSDRVPVVFATGTGDGSTLSHTYGFPGSESDLLRRGAISAGWLDARKARLLLWALLAIRASGTRVATEFERRGGSCFAPATDR